MEPNTELLLQVLYRVVPLLIVWTIATRVGRYWLKPGHGPLWFVSAAVVAGCGAWLVLGPQDHWLRLLYRTFIGRSILNQIMLAMAGLIVLFVVLRIGFGIGHTLWRRRDWRHPPVPYSFMWAGIAPDGSPLMKFRRMVWWMLGVALLAATAAVLAMDPAVDYTGWSFTYTAILGLLLGATHPVEPIRPITPEAEPPAPPKPPRVADFTRLHERLGNPREVEQQPAVSPLTMEETRGLLLGLSPYPFQARLCREDAPVVAMAGPHGTGRTSGALMSAVDAALGAGRTSVFISPNIEGATEALELAQRRLRQNTAGVGLMLESGSRLQNGDLWFISLDELEEFLDEQQDLVGHAFIRRLRLVVMEDVELLSGFGLPRARFLLHRLMAATEREEVRVFVTGNLPQDVLVHVTKLITTRDPEVIVTSGLESREGARSLPVRRFLVEPSALESPELEDVRRLFVRIIEEDRLDGELLGEPWPLWRHDLNEDGSPDVMLAHVGPRTAWRVLAHRRYYAGIKGGEVREYLLFDNDPMSQLILRQAQQNKRWWPEWYDTKRFPRILSAAPGGLNTPAGLEYEARHQLRASLDEAPQEVDRLEAVFSPRIAGAEVGAMRSRGLSARVQGWRINPQDLERPVVMDLARTTSAASAVDDLEATLSRDTITLRDPTTNFVHEVSIDIIDLLYYPEAIVTIRAQRYRVRIDPREPRQRLLQMVSDRDLETAPIRSLHVVPRGDDMTPTRVRFQGNRALEIFRGRVALHAVHKGVRDFSNQHRRRMHESRLDRPLEYRVVTSAWIVCAPGANETMLHTLTHVLREVLDHFFHGASKAIGLTYEMDFMGRAGLVFYDLHPKGLGCLYDIDDRQDLGALLLAARHILEDCDCQSACTRCSESMTCTSDPHQDKLDRRAAMTLLEAILGQRRG